MKKYVRSSKVTANSDYSEAENRMMNNPAFKEIEDMASAYGYKVDYATINSRGDIDISVSSNGNNPYTSELYIGSANRNTRPIIGDVVVRISTTSYGSLTKSEYAEFCVAVSDAYDFADWLENYQGWSNLDVFD